jgi:hypothetical protein
MCGCWYYLSTPPAGRGWVNGMCKAIDRLKAVSVAPIGSWLIATLCTRTLLPTDRNHLNAPSIGRHHTLPEKRAPRDRKRFRTSRHFHCQIRCCRRKPPTTTGELRLWKPRPWSDLFRQLPSLITLYYFYSFLKAPHFTPPLIRAVFGLDTFEKTASFHRVNTIGLRKRPLRPPLDLFRRH